MPESTPQSELLERCEQAIAIAQTAGAQQASAGASKSRSVDFEYRDGKLEKVQESTSRSLGIQLYVDGRYSSHSTTDLRPERLQAFIDEAVALTRALQPDEHRKLPEDYGAIARIHLDLVDDSLDALTEEDRIAWCAEMDSALHADDQVISTTSGVSQAQNTSAKVTSNGFAGQHASTSLWMGTEVTLDDPAGGRPEAWCWTGGHHRGDMWTPAATAAEALRLCKDRLGSTKGPSKKTTMVVDPRAGRRLVGALLRGANARSIQQGRSFWAGQTDQQLFSDKLTLVDDPLRVRGLASRHYDGEGLASRELTLVGQGVVRDVYVDTYYGRKANMTPTTGSRSNVLVQPGEGDLASILADVGECVYVTSWLGGNHDDTTGDFSFGLRGHAVENGEIGPPIGEMNITGNLKDLFASLVRVGDDPWLFSTVLTPTMVFEGVQFSGA